MPFIFLIVAFTFNSIANIMLKLNAKNGLILSGFPRWQFFMNNSYFLLALFIFGLNVIFYTIALKHLPLSVAYPVMTVSSFIIINSFSFIYLKEPITFLQVIGYFLVLSGIFFIIFLGKR